MSAFPDGAGFAPRLGAFALDALLVPGKVAFSIKVVDARSGGRPSVGKLAARAIAYIISAAPLFLGFAWIAIDRRRQAWHDKIAGTRVVYEDE